MSYWPPGDAPRSAADLFAFQTNQPVAEQDDGVIRQPALWGQDRSSWRDRGRQQRRGNAKIDRIPVGADNQRLSVIRYVVCDPGFAGQ